MKDLQMDMDMLICRSEIEGEIKRVKAIKYCFDRDYTEHTSDSLDLVIGRLNKVLEILEKY